MKLEFPVAPCAASGGSLSQADSGAIQEELTKALEKALGISNSTGVLPDDGAITHGAEPQKNAAGAHGMAPSWCMRAQKCASSTPGGIVASSAPGLAAGQWSGSGLSVPHGVASSADAWANQAAVKNVLGAWGAQTGHVGWQSHTTWQSQSVAEQSPDEWLSKPMGSQQAWSRDPNPVKYPWRAQSAVGETGYGPAEYNTSQGQGGCGPYAQPGSGSVQQERDGDSVLFAGYNAFTSRPVSETPGRYNLYLKPKQDGSSANDLQVIAWAKTYPAGKPFVTDEASQVKYRSTPGKGLGKQRKPYALILTPRYGKGNVTVYLRTGLVQINCGEDRICSFMQVVQDWTTAQQF